VLDDRDAGGLTGLDRPMQLVDRGFFKPECHGIAPQ
jgi:hypothetical protein